MKRVGVTQRVERIESYDEVRDCLDQRWSDLLLPLNALCVPLPNIQPEVVHDLLVSLQIDMLIFSGGNTLTSVKPIASDASHRRDQFEYALLDASLTRSIPVLGICRGMQLINVALGGSLQAVQGHVATRHRLVQLPGANLPVEVNSYHEWTIPPDGLAAALTPLAFDEKGNIEAFEHKSARLSGVMWHPEREPELSPEDLQLIKDILE